MHATFSTPATFSYPLVLSVATNFLLCSRKIVFCLLLKLPSFSFFLTDTQWSTFLHQTNVLAVTLPAFKTLARVSKGVFQGVDTDVLSMVLRNRNLAIGA
mmetsp:Transcript_31516/g.57062  ORF Transcript_31516/g.57062 Transcript_31516/m.57062 type:complete len:100 (+) Transcript_31516:71-370(+)